jgi:hypothetical protein
VRREEAVMPATYTAVRLDQLVEVAFPGWPTPLAVAAALAPAAPRSWATQREAGAAAAVVGGVVGVPALIAAGTVVTTVVLTLAVLVAPLIAVVLAWVAWRCNRVDVPGGAPALSPGA